MPEAYLQLNHGCNFDSRRFHCRFIAQTENTFFRFVFPIFRCSLSLMLWRTKSARLQKTSALNKWMINWYFYVFPLLKTRLMCNLCANTAPVCRLISSILCKMNKQFDMCLPTNINSETISHWRAFFIFLLFCAWRNGSGRMSLKNSLIFRMNLCDERRQDGGTNTKLHSTLQRNQAQNIHVFVFFFLLSFSKIN